MGRANKPGADPAVDGSTWSFCWQAAVGREFFATPALAARIRARLLGAHQVQERGLIDFVLSPTEIHVISRISEGDSVSGIARAFGNVVSRWVREAQPVRSPVLAGPYRVQRIDSTAALRSEVRMLAWRPVLLGACVTPTHHPNGALRIALGLTPAQGFDSRPLLMQFGATVPSARAALRDWIATRPSDREWRAWELARSLELATSSVGPRPTMARAVDGDAAALIAAGGGHGVDGALVLLEDWIRLRMHPAEALDLQADSTAAAVRGRALVACLAVSHRLCSAASVARHFRRSKSTLCEQMAACRARPADRLILGTPLHSILVEAEMLRATGAARAHHPGPCNSEVANDVGVPRGLGRYA